MQRPEPGRPVDLEEALELALSAARAAGPGILRAFGDPQLARERKADGTLVTAADRAAELEIRAVLRAHPRLGTFGVLGEESGFEAGAGDLRWVVDPIDGTISFSRGLPLFGTLVALEEIASGRALVGVIHLPALGETTWAARGLGAFREGAPIHCSQADELRPSIVSVPDSGVFRLAGREPAQAALFEGCDHLRGATDCAGHAWTARGLVDATFEPYLAPWDLAATRVIIEEAGGVLLTSASRNPEKLDALFGAPALVARIAQLVGFDARSQTDGAGS